MVPSCSLKTMSGLINYEPPRGALSRLFEDRRPRSGKVIIHKITLCQTKFMHKLKSELLLIINYLRNQFLEGASLAASLPVTSLLGWQKCRWGIFAGENLMENRGSKSTRLFLDPQQPAPYPLAKRITGLTKDTQISYFKGLR
jgi:hypothetical protein